MRKNRILRPDGIYHVILRGINRQDIFWEDKDYAYFLTILYKCKEISHFQLHAYCLMPNHIHLLLQTADEPLDLVLKRIEVRFVHWYNQKNDRVGHLFQDRYKSSLVSGDAAFCRTLRYIIQNPMKAGIETIPGTYRWSSFYSYFGDSDSLTDISLTNCMFASSEELHTFLCQSNSDIEMEASDFPKNLTDEKAAAIMKKITGCATAADFQRMTKEDQLAYARMLRKHSMSYGQISRLTGLPKASIYRKIRGEELSLS